MGDIVYVEIETKGKALSAETVFGTVEAVKTVSDLFLPVSGKKPAHMEKTQKVFTEFMNSGKLNK